VQGLPRRFSDIDLVMVIGGDGVDVACQDRRLITWLARAGRSGGQPSRTGRVAGSSQASVGLRLRQY
jgi:hypothetical protein